MSDKTSLGDRMKGYEDVWRQKMPRRTPFIIRVDGRAFHTLTRGMDKPFDREFVELMQDTARFLCQEIQGVQLAYVQSDEISLLVHDYKSLQSEAWFDKNIQKMVSISAGLASAYFTMNSDRVLRKFNMPTPVEGKEEPRYITFDSRTFVLPEAEVCNYFLWRQQDATRNSIQMLARSLYSHNECENKNTSDLQEMCFAKGQNWNDLPTTLKRGSCVIYQDEKWVIHNEIPIFSQDREYIEKHLDIEEE